MLHQQKHQHSARVQFALWYWDRNRMVLFWIQRSFFPFWNWLNNATSMLFMLQLLAGTIHVNNFLCRFYIGDCANVLLICPETRMCHQHILHYMDCNSCLSDDDYIFTFTGMTYIHSTPLYLLFMKSSLRICFIYTGQQRSFILRNHGILHCFPLLVCS